MNQFQLRNQLSKSPEFNRIEAYPYHPKFIISKSGNPLLENTLTITEKLSRNFLQDVFAINSNCCLCKKLDMF